MAEGDDPALVDSVVGNIVDTIKRTAAS